MLLGIQPTRSIKTNHMQQFCNHYAAWQSKMQARLSRFTVVSMIAREGLLLPLLVLYYSILFNSAVLAGWLTQVPVIYTVPALQERYLYTPRECDIGNSSLSLSLSLSGKDICVSNQSMRQILRGSKLRPYMLQGNLISKPSEVKGEGEDSKAWHQKLPSQGCLSCRLDTSLSF